MEWTRGKEKRNREKGRKRREEWEGEGRGDTRVLLHVVSKVKYYLMNLSVLISCNVK